MKLAFVINGNVRRINTVVSEIKEAFTQHDIGIFISEYAQHYTTLVQEALKDNFINFILVGGDGSLNEGINAIIQFYKSGEEYNWTAIASVKIAVYPAGSGNDFVKTLYCNQINSIFDLKALIEKDASKMIDVGLVHYQNKTKDNAVRFYINITDVGVGGDTVERKDRVPKWLGANISYMWAITSSITQYNSIQMEASYDGQHWSGRAMSFVVANGKYFGNGLCVAPDAELDSGCFDITVVGNINLFEYIKNLGKIKKGIRIEHPEVHYFRAKEVMIISASNDLVTIDMDGDFIGYAPLKLTCLPSKLCFFVL